MNTLCTRFEERLAVLSPIIRRWAYRHYDDCGEVVEDLIQAAHIELWQRVETAPDEMLTMPDPFWMNAAKLAARNEFRRLRRQVSRQMTNRDGSRPVVQTIFAESELANDGDQSDDEGKDDLLSRHACKHHRSRYTRELLHAEARLDLEFILQAGFQALDQQYHDDMRRLMTDIMLDYSLVESRQRHGWTRNHAATLMRLMRDTFYEAANGCRPNPAYRGCKPKATDDELQRVHDLRSKGLSYAEIAARLGRSKGFVQNALRPVRVYDPVELERVRQLREAGLSYVKIGQAIGRSKTHVQRLLQLPCAAQ